MSKSTGDRPKVALLLDCDDRMADAIAEVPPGYRVHRWETGACNEDCERVDLPIRAYEPDLIIDDVRRPPLYDLTAYHKEADEIWKTDERAEEGFPLRLPALIEPFQVPFGTHPRAYETPEGTRYARYRIAMRPRELFGGLAAVEFGAVCIIFVNECLLQRQDRDSLYQLLAPGLKTHHLGWRGCDPSRCVAHPSKVWGDFFADVCAPAHVRLSVNDAARDEICSYWRRLSVRDASIPSVRDVSFRVEACFLNRGAQALGLVIRHGRGAIFVLPEFRDNTAAAVRLLTEIWPRMSGAVVGRPQGAEPQPQDSKIDLEAEGVWTRRRIREEYNVSDKTLQRMDKAAVEDPKQKTFPGWVGPCGTHKGRPIYKASMVRECEYLQRRRRGSVDSKSIARPEDYMTSTDDEQR